MKFLVNHIFYKFLALLILVTLPSLIYAQGGNPFDPGDFPCFPPPCIPIDGGLTFLIAAGAAMAGKKLYDKSKEN